MATMGMVVAGVAAWSGCVADTASPSLRPEAEAEAEPVRTQPRTSALLPLPAAAHLDPRKVALGRRLFFDPRLGEDGHVACVTCHDLERGGVDGRVHSLGAHGAEGAINAPTVYNTAQNFRQFWDGRAANLEEQIEGPVHSSVELATSWPHIVTRLSADPRYANEFNALYRELSPRTIKDALASFERSLTAVDSRFDRYLRGDQKALDRDEQAGYARFVALGCASCHQGANVGGNMYETLGVMGDYFASRGPLTAADLGRYNVTHKDEDRYKFRVPSLRLAVLTAPYFHDGSARTLDEAIDVMARYQLGRRLSPRDKQLIIKFLATLPGQLSTNAHG